MRRPIFERIPLLRGLAAERRLDLEEIQRPHGDNPIVIVT